MQRTVPAPYPWLVLMAPGAAFTPHPHPRFFHMQRRQILARSAALASLLTPLAPAALAQATAARAAAPAAKAAKVAGTLRIVIPANPGGGWDQTGRALGAALKAVGAADQVEYENIGGKGGTIGLAKYAEKYGSDANTLLMGGMVMVGAVALQKPAVDMGHIQPIARLTSDYLVTAVPAASPIKNGKDLAEAMRRDLPALPVAGGSAGGVDHIYAGVLARGGRSILNLRPRAAYTVQMGQSRIGRRGVFLVNAPETVRSVLAKSTHTCPRSSWAQQATLVRVAVGPWPSLAKRQPGPCAWLTRPGGRGSISGAQGSLATQALACAATLAYSAAGTAVVLWLVGQLLTLRITPEQEALGLDWSQHAERLE